MTEIEQLKAILAEASQRIAAIEAAEAAQAEETWPKDGDTYWAIEDDGAEAFISTWASDDTDCARMAIGNVFRTRSDAEREAERRKVLTELRRLARESWGGGKADWSNDSQQKWCLFFSHYDGTWNTGRYTGGQDQGSVYFATEQAALTAIETIGAERLMLLLEE